MCSDRHGRDPAHSQPALHASLLNDVSVCKRVHAVVLNCYFYPSMHVSACLYVYVSWQKMTLFDLWALKQLNTSIFLYIYSDCVFILKH